MAKVGYFHARRMELVAGNGRLESRPHSKGGVTFAYMHDEKAGKLKVAWARCNVTDHYEKAVGRSIAVGRLADHVSVELPVKGDVYWTLWEFIQGDKELRSNMRCELRHRQEAA